ncbi:hypothetical protein JAAARDRAFT_62881 [Jaapia argillacea MUCL 33604]|uniref:Uncharacterized protein n=1 Tax=Jaapia argillacea MUCL 33604 TaxID=933084 RepID=A0A067PAI4_9AGAM|nr:hypothetical protein JAAARDRAFT_62881 [Jaapia argillacea MUCL 33604]
MQSNIVLTLFTLFAFFALLVPTFAAPLPVEVIQEKRMCKYTCSREADASPEPPSELELLARTAELEVREVVEREPLPSPLDVVPRDAPF